MAAPAVKVEIAKEAPVPRRFQIPDLDRHGRWIVDRLLKTFPHRTERDLVGWLRGIVYSNDYLFLYQDHGVALATVTRIHPLMPRAHVQEIFVFSQPGHEIEALAFYDAFATWAKHQGIDTLVVEELSDVPHEQIRDRLGRLFTKTVQFARL